MPRPMRLLRLHGDESGQAVAFFVGILVLLFGFMAFAIDFGFFFHARRLAQNAADGSVQAGASVLPGCGDGDPVAVALDYAHRNFDLLRTFSSIEDDRIRLPEVRDYLVEDPVLGPEVFPSVYTLLGRDQHYIFARFFGFEKSLVPADAQAVCGPITEGNVCPFYIEGDPSLGVQRDEEGNILSAYGLELGLVYGMKVNESGDHYGTLEAPGGSGVNNWRSFISSGCENDSGEHLDVSEGGEVATEPGDFANPMLQALEGGGPIGRGLYEIEKDYEDFYTGDLYPNGHLDCDFQLTLDGDGNVLSVRDYVGGHPAGPALTASQLISAINGKTDPSLMPSSTSSPCGGYRQDGSIVPELKHPSVQGRFMQIVLTEGSCEFKCDLPVLGILRMYILCWTNQEAESGSIPAADLCVPDAPPSQTTLYGIFADFTAPNALDGSGLGSNVLAPRHVVFVK